MRRLETGADNKMVKDPFVDLGCDANRVAPDVDLRDWVPQDHVAAGPNDVGGERFGNATKIDDRRFGDQQCGESSNVWLAVAKLCWVDHTRSGDTVGLRSVGQFEQVWKFVFAKSDDDLAEHFVGELPLGTEGTEEFPPRRHNLDLRDPGG